MGRGRGESDMLNGMSKAGVIYKVCFSVRGGFFCLFLLFALCTNAQRYQQLVKQGLEQMQKDSLQQAEATFREALEVDPLMKSNALLYQYIGNSVGENISEPSNLIIRAWLFRAPPSAFCSTGPPFICIWIIPVVQWLIILRC